jgi:hypothetical protein
MLRASLRKERGRPDAQANPTNSNVLWVGKPDETYASACSSTSSVNGSSERCLPSNAAAGAGGTYRVFDQRNQIGLSTKAALSTELACAISAFHPITTIHDALRQIRNVREVDSSAQPCGHRPVSKRHVSQGGHHRQSLLVKVRPSFDNDLLT